MAQCSGFDLTQAGFCCGGDFNCCTNSTGLLKNIPKFTALSHPPAPTSTSTAVGGGSAATTTTTTPATTPAAATGTNGAGAGAKSSSNSSNSSKATVVGVSVGVSLGVALLGVVGVLVWQQRRKHKTTTMNKTYNEMITPRPSSPFTVYSGQQPKDMVVELQSKSPVELQSTGPVELPATRHS